MPLLNHKVTICGIPELPQHCSAGITHVLSIIDTRPCCRANPAIPGKSASSSVGLVSVSQ